MARVSGETKGVIKAPNILFLCAESSQHLFQTDRSEDDDVGRHYLKGGFQCYVVIESIQVIGWVGDRSKGSFHHQPTCPYHNSTAAMKAQRMLYSKAGVDVL